MKVRIAEQCPALEEREFKEAIWFNYVDARKFKFSLNEAQVIILTLHSFMGGHSHLILVFSSMHEVILRGGHGQVQSL